MQSSLENAGWTVRAAANGTQAMRCVEQHHDELSALVTDIRLDGGPDGWDVASRARELSHGIGIVYVTGDSAGDWPAKGEPHSVLIQKPFSEAQLVAAVASLLDQSA